MKESKLYLDNGSREFLVQKILTLKEVFKDDIIPIFADIGKKADAFEKEIREGKRPTPSYIPEDDYEGFIQYIEDAGQKKYQDLTMLHYQTICMWISCLDQVWEQDIISFILNKAKKDKIHYYSKDKKKEIKLDFYFAKCIFNMYGFNFEELKIWPKIKELRLLVNVIKHGEGISSDNLKKIHPEYYKISSFNTNKDLLSLFHSSLGFETLNVKEEDFLNYCNILVEFWRALPENMLLNKYPSKKNKYEIIQI